MSAVTTITGWGIERAKAKKDRAAYLHAVKVASGKRSAEVRRAKGGLVEHLRRIAPLGGKARGPLDPVAQRRLASIGGKASWAKLTPEEARAKRSHGIAQNKKMTHAQRVAIGKLGAEKRWGKK